MGATETRQQINLADQMTEWVSEKHERNREKNGINNFLVLFMKFIVEAERERERAQKTLSN